MEKDYVKSSKTAKGPNSSLVKGTNPALLLSNYLPVKGPGSLSKGPQSSNLVSKTGLAVGPNPKLAKGSTSMWVNKKNSPTATNTYHHHVTVN